MSVHLSGRSSVPVIYQCTEHCHRLDKMLDGVMQGAISVAEDLQVWTSSDWCRLVPGDLLSGANGTRLLLY